MRIGYRIAAILLMVTAVLGLSGCQKADFKQSEIPSTDIPAQMLEYAAERRSDSTPLWRALYEEGTYDIGVAYYVSGGPTGSLEYWYWFVFEGERRVTSTHVLITRAVAEIGRYEWHSDEKFDISGESFETAFYAYGWAWDAKAVKVIGTTKGGLSYEGPVVNGYWMLFEVFADEADQFETVTVVDEQGKILHTYDQANKLV